MSREPQYIRDMYGPGVQARQLLVARRLLEKGVRFVQVWHGESQPWDNHDDLAVNHRRLAGQCDQAIGALLTDLKQRGMWEDTLVIWGGEFGRTPVVELPTPGANAGRVNGRDHNHWGYTTWLAGGGVRGGTVYGATDPFGFQAIEPKVHVHDLQATILWLLGFDHELLHISVPRARFPADRCAWPRGAGGDGVTPWEDAWFNSKLMPPVMDCHLLSPHQKSEAIAEKSG